MSSKATKNESSRRFKEIKARHSSRQRLTPGENQIGQKASQTGKGEKIEPLRSNVEREVFPRAKGIKEERSRTWPERSRIPGDQCVDKLNKKLLRSIRNDLRKLHGQTYWVSI